MSKSVVIEETGVKKTVSYVSKLQVRGESSTDTWIPQDETVVGELTIRKNGEYVPADYGLYGAVLVNVMVQGGTGAEWCGGMPGGPDVEVVAYPLDPKLHPSPSQYVYTEPLPSDSGSIRGTDPETGENVTISVVGGVLTKTVEELFGKPASIQVLVPPKRLTYRRGEAIDYTGLVVALVREDGTLFSSGNYPDGTIAYDPDAKGPTTDNPTLNLVLATPTTRFTEAGPVRVIWRSPYDNARLAAQFTLWEEG